METKEEEDNNIVVFTIQSPSDEMTKFLEEKCQELQLEYIKKEKLTASPELILKLVLDYFDTTLEFITERHTATYKIIKNDERMRIRQYYAYMCKQYCPMYSKSQIMTLILQDHSSYYNSCKRINNYLYLSDIKQHVDNLHEIIKANLKTSKILTPMN